MKKYIFPLAILVALAALLSACGGPNPEPRIPTIQTQLADTGLFGRHSLDSAKEITLASGSFSSQFFLALGSSEGTYGDTTVISFTWSPVDGETVPSEIQRTKFRTIIDDSLDKPEIEFVFDETWLNSCFAAPNNLICGLMSNSDKANLNDFIQSPYLKLIRVYISAEDKANEPALP